MKSMKVGKHCSLLPFQKGIILTNTSLQQLFPYLKQKYGNNFDISYIMTARLNQDILENFFHISEPWVQVTTNHQHYSLNID